MADALDVELLASATKTNDGQSVAVDTTDEGDGVSGPTRQAAKLLLEVTAASGTGATLDVEVQTSPSSDASGAWETVASFEQATGKGFQRLCFAPLERYVRVAWTIKGDTPSFTLAVSGQAHVIYAVPDDLGLPAAVLANLTNHKVARQLIRITDRAQGHVAGSHQTPLERWSDDLRYAVIVGADYELMVEHGFRPEKYDANFRHRYVDVFGDAEQGTKGWLEKVASGQLETPDTVDATPDTEEGGSYVYSQTKRGW